MSLTLSYPLMQGSFTPSGVDIDQFSDISIHDNQTHNNPHAKLLANDQQIAAYINQLNLEWADSSYSLNDKGWFKVPSSGFFIQWAKGNTMSSETTQIIGWPLRFQWILNAQVGAKLEAYGAGFNEDEWFQIISFNTLRVTVRYQWTGYGGQYPMTPYVIGIGFAY